jgi:bifunctional non-homologous end joining protein LigD
MPSIVPSGPSQDVFLVLDQFGERLGRAWRETDENDTDYETLIRHLLEGQCNNPVRVVRVERDGDRVRLITRGGYDWTKRYPWIVEAALKNRHKQFVIDGEAVVLGVDGISDFNALHSGKHNDEVQLYAFDILALNGDDLRYLPLSMRKAHLERLLARRPDGIFISSFEQGEIGPDLFRAACNMGLEGLVSKRRDRPYQSGRSKHWMKVKNRRIRR